MEAQTWRLSLTKIGFAEYEYKVCSGKILLGICTKQEKKTVYRDLNDPSVVADFVARGFVLRVRDQF